MSNTTPLVTGLFRDRNAAERAYRIATERGYTHDELNLVVSDEGRRKHFTGVVEAPDGAEVDATAEKTAAGAGIGGVIGGGLGAVLAALVAMGVTLMVPGMGLVVAGPLAAGLMGAGAGAATGGFIGALVGWNLPAERAKGYEDGIKNGGILLGVRPRNEIDAAFFENEWKAFEADAQAH